MYDLYGTIKAMAKKRGMTLTEFEERAGFARGTVHKWKTSSPTLSSLEKVANVLDVKVTTLLGNSKK